MAKRHYARKADHNRPFKALESVPFPEGSEKKKAREERAFKRAVKKGRRKFIRSIGRPDSVPETKQESIDSMMAIFQGYNRNQGKARKFKPLVPYTGSMIKAIKEIESLPRPSILEVRFRRAIVTTPAYHLPRWARAILPIVQAKRWEHPAFIRAFNRWKNKGRQF